jgi:hypothetical protein
MLLLSSNAFRYDSSVFYKIKRRSANQPELLSAFMTAKLPHVNYLGGANADLGDRRLQICRLCVIRRIIADCVEEVGVFHG